MSCDDMWIIHYWMLEKGLPPELDGSRSIHISTLRRPGRRKAQWISILRGHSHLFALMQIARSVPLSDGCGSSLSSSLDDEAEMWITEWGFPVGQQVKNGLLLSEDMVAAFVPRAFITAASAGVKVLCWFSSQDSVDGPMGLRGNDGKRRKAFGAFRTMTEQIGDYTLVRQVIGQDHPTTGVQAYLFRGAKGNKLVIWSVDDEMRVLLGPSDGSAIRVNDVQGKALKVNADKDGRVRVVVGAKPIYVSGISGEVLVKPVRSAPKAPANLRKEDRP